MHACRSTLEDPTGLRILVAEDVALNAEMLQVTLEQSGHSVHVVPDGARALEAVRGETFDVILMDVQMPGMDGLEATRAIRALGGPAAAVPIIALTAYASRDDLKTCLDSGMNDFLTKPLERPKLQQALARLGAPARPRDRATSAAGAADPPAPQPRGSAGGNVERVGELLVRLGGVDRDDRDAVRALADSLTAAAAHVGFDGLADRARRLTAAAPRSNVDALGALIEDITDAGRRSLDDSARSRHEGGRAEGHAEERAEGR